MWKERFISLENLRQPVTLLMWDIIRDSKVLDLQLDGVWREISSVQHKVYSRGGGWKECILVPFFTVMSNQTCGTTGLQPPCNEGACEGTVWGRHNRGTEFNWALLGRWRAVNFLYRVCWVLRLRPPPPPPPPPLPRRLLGHTQNGNTVAGVDLKVCTFPTLFLNESLIVSGLSIVIRVLKKHSFSK